MLSFGSRICVLVMNHGRVLVILITAMNDRGWVRGGGGGGGTGVGVNDIITSSTLSPIMPYQSRNPQPGTKIMANCFSKTHGKV